MENNNDKEMFSYTYSAKEQSEIEKIRNKYMPKGENKMERLRRMDRAVTQKANTVSLIVGILGCLIMGSGMSMCMIASNKWFVPGIVIGIIGMAVAAVAYPMYNKIVKKEKDKIAPEIIKLTDELMK